MIVPPIIAQLATQHFTHYVARELVQFGDQAPGLTLLVEYTPDRSVEFSGRVAKFAKQLQQATTRLEVSYGYLVTNEIYSIVLTLRRSGGRATSSRPEAVGTVNKQLASEGRTFMEALEIVQKAAEQWFQSRASRYVKQHDDETCATVEIDASNGDGTITVRAWGHSDDHDVDMEYELLVSADGTIHEARLKPGAFCFECKKTAEEYDRDGRSYY